MNPFRAPSRLDGAWHKVGLASAFPDLDIDYDGRRITAKCKAFRIPNLKTNGPQEAECPVEADIDLPGDLKDQVLVFKYKGKFHAIDHQCPHSSFPLSQGSLFDIEDFGVVLSAGITCPKHGWSFDLFSGQSDRGNYKLKVWEVQLRDLPASTDGASETTDKEVWDRPEHYVSPVPHRYFFSKDGDPAITGPFTKEEDFSKAIALRSRQNWSDRGRHGWTSDFMARHHPSALSGHQPTFTHGDLYRENILVNKVKNPTSGVEEYRIAAIIDWETVGWYPPYWEYAYIFALFQWVDDWPASVERIIDPWPSEAALLRFVHEDLEF